LAKKKYDKDYKEMKIWTIVGFIGQFMFFSRFLVQWMVSERQKKSVVPKAFWYLSLAGGLFILAYSIKINDPVFILGQSCGVIVYVRNLILMNRSKQMVGE
jgi:lipid-A-disaccharide synthase-like uncharacterized protein